MNFSLENYALYGKKRQTRPDLFRFHQCIPRTRRTNFAQIELKKKKTVSQQTTSIATNAWKKAEKKKATQKQNPSGCSSRHRESAIVERISEGVCWCLAAASWPPAPKTRRTCCVCRVSASREEKPGRPGSWAHGPPRAALAYYTQKGARSNAPMRSAAQRTVLRPRAEAWGRRDTTRSAGKIIGLARCFDIGTGQPAPSFFGHAGDRAPMGEATRRSPGAVHYNLHCGVHNADYGG